MALETDAKKTTAVARLPSAGEAVRWGGAPAAHLLLCLCLSVPSWADEGRRPAAEREASPTSAPSSLGFQPNQGQWAPDVRFAGHWGPLTVAFRDDAVIVTVPAETEQSSGPAEIESDQSPLARLREVLEQRGEQRWTRLVMRFSGANEAPRIRGLERLPGKSYYIGADPSDGPAAFVPRYARIEYQDLYPGVDLVFYSKEGRFEYDVVVRPGADPSVVSFEFDGMDDVMLSPEGDLVLQTSGGRLRHKQPRSFAEADGRKDPVQSRFRLDGRRMRFEVSGYDRRRKLRIDPVIEWEAAPGGGPLFNVGGVAADAEGNSYVAGLLAPPDGGWALEGPTLFVTKFDPSGSVVHQTSVAPPVKQAGGDTLQWQWEVVWDITVDAEGAVYLVGAISPWAYSTAGCGGFLAKITPDGSALAFPVAWVTGFNLGVGGFQLTAAYGVDVDVEGNAYVVGETYHIDYIHPNGDGSTISCFFPANVSFPLPRPVHYSTYCSFTDAFLVMFDSYGRVVSEGLFGGSRHDWASDVAVDRSGAVNVVGWTRSSDFPTTEEVLQGGLADACSPPGCTYGDAFLVKLEPRLSGVQFSTLLGGELLDMSLGVAVDRWGNGYVAGTTRSIDFPRVPGTDPMPEADYTAFLTKVTRKGDALRYSRAYAQAAGGNTWATNVVVGGDGRSYWLVKSGFVTPEGLTSCSLTLTVLSRTGELEEEQLLSSGDTWCNPLAGLFLPQGHSVGLGLDAEGNVFVTGQLSYGSPGTVLKFDTGRALMRPDARCHGECVAANPAHRVNAVTGNAWLDQADGEGFSAGDLLPFGRSYNSQAAVEGIPGPLGPGWSHAYSRHMEFVAGGQIRLLEDDGVPTVYTDPEHDGRYVAATPITDTSWIDRATEGFVRYYRDGGTEEYNVYGQLRVVVDASGDSVTLERDDTGQVSTVTTSNGASLDLAYEDTPNELRLTELSYGSTTLASYEYDANGYLSAVTRPGIGTFHFRYDDNGQLLTASDGSRRVVAAFTYDDEYRATASEIGAGQERFSFDYGSAQTAVTDGQGWTTTYTWAEIHGLRAITGRTAPCDACDAGGDYVDAWAYTPEGRVESHDSNGLLTSFTYNDHGDLETVTDPQLRPTSYEYVYDGNGRVVRQTRLGPAGSRVEWTFGNSGVSSVTESLTEETGRTVSFSYESGRVRSMSDAAGKVWEFERDSLGRLAATMTPVGARIEYDYDPLGRVTSITNELGAKTSLTYDGVDQVSKVERADDTSIEFKYDDAGRLLRTIDPLNRTTGRSYDSRGRLVGVRDAANGSTRFGYDSLSRLERLTDAKGRTTRFTYNNDGSVRQVVSPGGATEEYAYNRRGWVTERTDRRGVRTTYSYDTVGRLTGKSYSDGTPGVTFEYDDAGRLEIATNGADSLTWTYDLAGQPRTETSARAGTTLEYTYGLRGNLLGFKLNGTVLRGYSYDDDGRLTTLSSLAGDFLFEYDDASRRSELTHPNGVVTDYEYDDLSRLTSMVAHQSGVPVASHAYTYDAAGNRTSRTTLDLAESYSYDAVDRLKTVARAGHEGVDAFAYDRVGNRLASQAASGGVRGASYNDRNQLTGISGGGTLLFRGTLDEPGVVTVNGQPARMLSDRVFEAEVPVATGTNTVTVEAWDTAGNQTTEHYTVDQPSVSAVFQYDENGNLVQKTEGGYVFGYEWNAENEITRVTRDGMEIARFLYDPLGRRVQKVVGGVTYDYVYDGADILKETRSDGVSYEYVHGPGIDEPLARINQTGTLNFYHPDGLGSIVKVTDSTGGVIEARQYDAWGNLETAGSEPGYAYTGREWDPEISLYYYRARYYDPKIGRFISEDPAEPGSFSYVANNPGLFRDPSGLRLVLSGADTEKMAGLLRQIAGSHGGDLLYTEAIGDGQAEVKYRGSERDALAASGLLGVLLADVIDSGQAVELSLVPPSTEVKTKYQCKTVAWGGGGLTVGAEESTKGITQVLLAPDAGSIASFIGASPLYSNRSSDGNALWFSTVGVLVHELGHALANLNGLPIYNSRSTWGEAVMWENIWRDRYGTPNRRLRH